MKILIEESVLRQVLEALSNCEGMLPEYHQWLSDTQLSLRTALRETLDAAEKVEPVGVFKLNTETGYWHQLTKSVPRFEDDGAVELFTHPAPAVPKLGAGKTAHDWKCVSPGEYDTLYECAKCGARHMEQADRLGSDRPKFGCTHNDQGNGPSRDSGEGPR